MTYSLYKNNGHGGDSGPMSECVFPDGKKTVRPTIGGRMMVGSPYARTYEAQDYWLTTEIEEILLEKPDEVVFRTRTGSIYHWCEF